MCSGSCCGLDETVNLSDEDFRRIHETIRATDFWLADMRRYLYRNVACEFRKSLKDFSKMLDVPGWS